jgi:tetratricopeptide (TPR) repeat protein
VHGTVFIEQQYIHKIFGNILTQFQYIINALWMLAIIPVAGLMLWHMAWKKRVGKKMGDARLVNQMIIGASPTRNRIKTILFISAVALLSVAMMNLQKPVQQAGGGLKGLDVMIALDVSNSMMANDVSPNRLERARLLAARLIDTMQGNRVGIIAFAGEAYLQLPLTTDLTAARLYLQSVSTSLVPTQGTNIHDALELANQSMDPADHQYKAVLLITDGEELDKKALDAAKEIKKSGVVILPVGIGTPGGATLPGDNGEPRKDEKGQTVISKLNETLLKELAGETNGTYRLMGETDLTLQSITSELRSMDKKPISNTSLVNYKSYSHWMIAIALFLLLIELLLPAKVLNAAEASGSLKRKSLPAKAAAVLALFIWGGINANAQSTRMMLHKANEAYRQQQYDEAEKLYQSVLKADPANNVARYNLGNIAYRRKQFEEAAKDYDNVTAQNTAETKAAAGAWNNKGLSYVQQKDLPKAIESFKQSIRENPFDEEVRNNLNKALQEQQKQQQQPDSNKQQPPKPKPQNKMKKNEAEEKLAALRQEEKKIRDKIKQPATGVASDKDW